MLVGVLLVGARDQAWCGSIENRASLEHPSFNHQQLLLTVGRDGRLYMASWIQHQGSYCLRLDLDGGNRGGTVMGNSVFCVAANKDGTMFALHAEWDEQWISIHDGNFNQTYTRSYPLGHEGVAVGASGDFYVRSNDFIRIAPDGHEVQHIPNPVKADQYFSCGFAVCESKQWLFVLGPDEHIHVVDFTGKEVAKVPADVTAYQAGWRGGYGGFDADDGGRLYVLNKNSNTVSVFTFAKDENLGKIDVKQTSLPLGEQFGWVSQLCLTRSDDQRPAELLVRERDTPYLYRRFDCKTGKLIGTVMPRGMHVKVTWPGDFWPAGASIPWSLEFDSGDTPMALEWRVWARPLGGLDFRELAVADGKLQVPADFGGLYHVKVSAEPSPIEQQAGPMLAAQGVVEVRRRGAIGTVSVYTPQSRLWYGQSESIPFNVALSPAAKASEVTIRLTGGERTILQWKTALKPGQPTTLEVPAATTRLLHPVPTCSCLKAMG